MAATEQNASSSARGKRTPAPDQGRTSEPPSGAVTDILANWRDGDARSLDRLAPLVYSELRRIARERLGGERRDHTLQATELVHEAYLRLCGKDHPSWRDRSHFFAVAALVMRRVLIDHARRRSSQRRGGRWERVPIEERALVSREKADELLVIDQLLDELASFDPRKNRIIWLRFFAGLSIQETAEALGVSRTTVVREHRLARAWLLRKMAAKESSS